MSAPAPEDAGAALVRLVRDEGRTVLATLTRSLGSLQLAEDAVQDAVVKAMEVWPRDGVPPNPRAWLLLTARRRAIDVVRREAQRAGKEAEAVKLLEPEDGVPADSVLADDLLRLVFTCCHPALALESQVALALRTLCGLSTAEVARALLVPEQTMAKRLTRAKNKIAVARIPYAIPADHELPDRVAGVASCVYLLFNEGYAATSGDAPVRADLVDEAIRLGRLLHRLMPDEPSVLGLLALMLLQDARRSSRHDGDGRPVLLKDQDRRSWRQDLVKEGVELTGQALRRGSRPNPFAVQAAIAGCHALAPTWDDTDWGAVVSWYDILLTALDTPVVRLNRAVAVAERDGPAAGLELLDGIEDLAGYPLWHAARAELLLRLDRSPEAEESYGRALALEQNASQRAFLESRRDALS